MFFLDAGDFQLISGFPSEEVCGFLLNLCDLGAKNGPGFPTLLSCLCHSYAKIFSNSASESVR